MAIKKKVAHEIAKSINKFNETNDWFNCTAIVERVGKSWEVKTDTEFSETNYDALRKIADFYELIYDTRLLISICNDVIYIW